MDQNFDATTREAYRLGIADANKRFMNDKYATTTEDGLLDCINVRPRAPHRIIEKVQGALRHAIPFERHQAMIEAYDLAFRIELENIEDELEDERLEAEASALASPAKIRANRSHDADGAG